MRADRELACDALVLTRTHRAESHPYGQTMVALLERFSQSRPLPAMAGILESQSQLKRRITMIARYKTNSYQWSPLALVLIAGLAAFALPDARRTRAGAVQNVQPTTRVVLRRIWSDSYAGPMGAPSPDGRYFSYVDWETGDLALYETSGGTRRRLTSKGTWDASEEAAYSSCWSPDSQQIVYCWQSQEQRSSEDVPISVSMDLRVIGIHESKIRLLCNTQWARVYDWSPDGKHILACLLGKDGESQIALVSAADGSVRGLREASDYSEWPKKMAFSPDGKYIVYSRPQGEGLSENDLFLMTIDGTDDVPLVKHPADDFALGWAPDGSHILFASDRTGTLDLWLMAVADGRAAGDPILVKENLGPFEPMGFTEEGAYYYLSLIHI